jgi:hypothetical protein
LIEAYRIGVSLFLETNVNSALPGLIRQFEALDKIIKSAQSNATTLGSQLRGIARAEPGIRTLAATMERLHQAQARAAESARALNRAVTDIPSGGAAGAAAAAAAAANAAARGGPRATPPAAAPQLPALYVPPGGPGAVGAGPLTTPGRGVMPFQIPLGAPGIPLNYKAPPERPSSSEFMQTGLGLGMVGAAVTEFVDSVVKARAEVEHAQSGLRTMGFSAAQAARALDQAIDLQRNVPGMTIGGGLHMIQDVMSLLQKPEEALNPDALKAMAQTAIVLQSAGKGDAIGNLFKAIQAGELRGALSGPDGEIDPAGLMKFLRNVEVTTVQTGGRVGPAEILQFLKSSNAAGAMLADPALFADSIMPILSMGAAKAGTALQGFSMQMASGKMSEAAANMLLEGGMLHLREITDEDRAYKRRKGIYPQLIDFHTGIGQFRFPQNVLPDAREAQLHPYEFIEKTMLPFIDRYDAMHGGLATDPDALRGQRMATAQQLASRIPGGALIGDVIRNYLLLKRDRDAIAGGGERDAFKERVDGDPKLRFQEMEAAVNGLMVALGGPVMGAAVGVVKDITGALNAMSAWAERNPGTAGLMVKTAEALGALSLAVGAASLVFGFAGPMIKTFQWLAGAEAAAMSGNVTMFGVAMAGAATAARLSLVALGAYAAGTALHSGFDYLAGKLGDGVHGLLGETDGQRDSRHDWYKRAQQADDKFSIFDRSTWADPNGSWMSAAPRYPALPDRNKPIQLNGTVNLDGQKVGNVIARGIGGAAGTGTSGPDVRVNPWPGMGLP